jgi:hypothetical protein
MIARIEKSSCPETTRAHIQRYGGGVMIGSGNADSRAGVSARRTDFARFFSGAPPGLALPRRWAVRSGTLARIGRALVAREVNNNAG